MTSKVDMEQDETTRPEAIEDLFRRYHRKVAQYYRNHGLPYQDSRDLAHDTFAQAAKGLDGYREEAPCSVWLWRIARNNMVSYLRRRRLTEVALDHDDLRAADVSDPAHDRNILAACVAQGFRSFAHDHPERADVLRLVVIEGWTIREIASFLGRTEGAAREYVSQCRKRLRPYLEHCHGN